MTAEILDKAIAYYARHCSRTGSIYSQPSVDSPVFFWGSENPVELWPTARGHVDLVNVKGHLATLTFRRDRIGRIRFAIEAP